MILDISLAYNASFSEFKFNNVIPITNDVVWISAHTEPGKKFLEAFGINNVLNEYTLISNDLGKELFRNLSKNGLSGVQGEFYWKDITHKIHI